MASSRGWGDLPADLLALIADGLPIQAYTRVRAVCTAWRAAIPAASPSLLVRLDWNRHDAWFLSPRISTALHENLATLLPARSSCLGSAHGWVAVHDPIFYELRFGLVNPLTGVEIPFSSFPHFVEHKLWVPKVVFAPSPTPSDFTAAAITGHGRVITYTAQGNSGWTDVECPRLVQGDYIADVVYHEERGGERAVYCLTTSGDVHALRLHAGAFEPLFDKGKAVFDAAAAFAPPYDTIRYCTNTKNLVVCDDGDLYQIWRNNTCTRMGPLPGGGSYRTQFRRTCQPKFDRSAS
uniref:KIB1-4 beta-propeller domain-containing protein n=1 Tax=Oryza punctata TaxID=4537 RepID=A0A0E0LQU1_ORYPU